MQSQTVTRVFRPTIMLMTLLMVGCSSEGTQSISDDGTVVVLNNSDTQTQNTNSSGESIPPNTFADESTDSNSTVDTKLDVPTAAKVRMLNLDGYYESTENYLGNGKFTLLMIWDESCSLSNFSDLSQFLRANQADNLEVLGVSIDGEENFAEVQAFLSTKDVAFPNLLSDVTTVANSYRELTEDDLIGTPTYLLFSLSGELLAAQAGVLDLDSLIPWLTGERGITDGKYE